MLSPDSESGTNGQYQELFTTHCRLKQFVFKIPEYSGLPGGLTGLVLDGETGSGD